MRFVQSNLVDAVEAGGYHRGGGAVHAGQTNFEQRPWVFRDVGMQAIAAEFDIAREVISGAKNGLDMRVRVHGDDLACAIIGDVELIGSEAVATAAEIGKPGGNVGGNGEWHRNLLWPPII